MIYKLLGIILFPLFFSYKLNGPKEKNIIDEDMVRYYAPYTGGYHKLIYLLLKHRPFRAVYYYRIKSKKFLKHFLNLLLPAPGAVEINGDVEGGLYIPHSFAVISVYKAGKNLTVLPGVVIGKKGKGDRSVTNPIIGSNCIVSANSTIFGPIVIGDNVVIGAGSVVLKDIPIWCRQ